MTIFINGPLDEKEIPLSALDLNEYKVGNALYIRRIFRKPVGIGGSFTDHIFFVFQGTSDAVASERCSAWIESHELHRFPTVGN